jgi:hypothetical protein
MRADDAGDAVTLSEGQQVSSEPFQPIGPEMRVVCVDQLCSNAHATTRFAH